MTRKQKIYFTWLVLRNAERISQRCASPSIGTAIIGKAYSKYRSLGYPYSEGKNTDVMKTDIVRMVSRLTGLEFEYVQVGNGHDLEEPF